MDMDEALSRETLPEFDTYQEALDYLWDLCSKNPAHGPTVAQLGPGAARDSTFAARFWDPDCGSMDVYAVIANIIEAGDGTIAGSIINISRGGAPPEDALVHQVCEYWFGPGAAVEEGNRDGRIGNRSFCATELKREVPRAV